MYVCVCVHVNILFYSVKVRLLHSGGGGGSGASTVMSQVVCFLALSVLQFIFLSDGELKVGMIIVPLFSVF